MIMDMTTWRNPFIVKCNPPKCGSTCDCHGSWQAWWLLPIQPLRENRIESSIFESSFFENTGNLIRFCGNKTGTPLLRSMKTSVEVIHVIYVDGFLLKLRSGIWSSENWESKSPKWRCIASRAKAPLSGPKWRCIMHPNVWNRVPSFCPFFTDCNSIVHRHFDICVPSCWLWRSSPFKMTMEPLGAQSFWKCTFWNSGLAIWLQILRTTVVPLKIC